MPVIPAAPDLDFLSAVRSSLAGAVPGSVAVGPHVILRVEASGDKYTSCRKCFGVDRQYNWKLLNKPFGLYEAFVTF
jgi:hypothetical protein